MPITRCPHCGAENDPSRLYCARCSRPLETEPREPVQRLPDRAATMRREIAVLSVGAALLLATAFGVWYIVLYWHSPRAVVQQFLDAEQTGRMEDARPLISRRTDAQLLLTAFQTIRKLTGSSPFQNATVGGTAYGGAAACVIVDITVPPRAASAAQGAPMPQVAAVAAVTFVLVQEDGEWRIDSAHTAANAASALATAGYAQLLGPGAAWPSPAPWASIPPAAPGTQAAPAAPAGPMR